MRRGLRVAVVAVLLILIVPIATTSATSSSVRFATFNASLNRNAAGQALTDLSTPGNAQAAADSARRAVALDPESAVALLNLAFAYQNGGRIDDAATGFKRVLELDPGNVKALVGLAETQYRQGSREQAFASYQRAAAAAPTFASVQTELGIVALELNRPDVAADVANGQYPATRNTVAITDEEYSLFLEHLPEGER